MRLAVIPARGGSKRIPRKNIRPFAGKPMIAWSIEAARASGLFDRILVTTDDDEIARIATDFGAEAPFRRPAELADDYTPTIPVIAHAVEWQAAHGPAPAQVCCIYATAPFIRADDIRRGFDPLKVGVGGEAIVEARPLQAVAVGHFDGVDAGLVQGAGDVLHVLERVLVTNRMAAVTQGHVGDIELFAGVEGHRRLLRR